MPTSSRMLLLEPPAATIAKYNKAAFTQNQYGFELDGPVIVPKLWSGKKQTFFLILYEDLHIPAKRNGPHECS
jgi:hypothetical protein